MEIFLFLPPQKNSTIIPLKYNVIKLKFIMLERVRCVLHYISYPKMETPKTNIWNLESNAVNLYEIKSLFVMLIELEYILKTNKQVLSKLMRFC